MRYAKAVFPDTFRCAGRTLATHTLGHALLLQRLGNPYAGRPSQEPMDASVGDLVQALHVCSRPWRRAYARIDGWRERLWMGWEAGRIRSVEVASMEFEAYLRDAWPVIPSWSRSDGKNRDLGAELLHSLIQNQRSTGLTLHGALDVPLAVAYWDAAAAAERNGVITIKTAREESLMDLFDSLQASGQLPRTGTVIERN